MKTNEQLFIEEIFELLLGDDAINRGFTYQDVLDQIKELNELKVKEEQGDL